MQLFSHRKGLKPLEKAVQRAGLDEETRNRFWTLLKAYIWDKANTHHSQAIQTLLDRLWFNYYKQPSDTQPPLHGNGYYSGADFYSVMREEVLTGKWHEVFDLIEFAVANLPSYLTEKFCPMANHVLTEENSAYRIVNGQFVEITNDSEIEEVDAAAATGLDGVSVHISAAVNFLSDRKHPDYRNSIKESISAVESLSKVLTKKKSATLSDGLKEMKNSFDIHPALLIGFEKLYAYTSDQDGIRHAIFDSPKSTFSDAKFMLVSCSAFINYAIGKIAESGKKIQ